MNLQAVYSREDFLVFLRDYLPDFSNDIRGADKTGLKVTQEITYLGESPELNLSIFELHHNSSIDARLLLSKDGFRLMKNHQLNKALIVYLPKESVDWRLSLLTATLGTDEKGNITKELSNPKRLSYFLGPNAKINTPKRFLLDLGKVKNFDDLLDRFNVEIVTKEFFKQYRNLFERLLAYLKKDFAFQAFAGQNEVDTTSFAKKLLGQIVFIYFLQRKGWLGAKKGEKISDGDRHFLRNLFETSRKENLDFFNFYLEPLFYDALNKPTNKPASFYRDYFECQIPFLNGGLFEPLQNYDWQNNHLNIPNKIFSNSEKDGILDIFDLYNFTIDESDPSDQEVSVDPEMLGKVFENLIEENLRKGKGTYYTPREIVHYMCQESLSNYLKSKVSGIDLNINSLIHFGEYSDLDPSGTIALTQEQSLNLDEALKSIKVVDPACGSGAFLVGVLHEIVKARSLLDHFNEKKASEYELKKESIQNCIYGVDIDPGAIEIAKLRLWLSLVVDYDLEDIEPLPNLDYKIMQGNSLLEELVLGDTTIKLYDRQTIQKAMSSKRMKNLFEADPQMAMFDDIKKEQALKNMKALQVQYFSQSDAGEKKKIKVQIEKIEHDLIEASVRTEVDMLSAQRLNVKTIPGVGLLPEDVKKLMNISSKEIQIMSVLDELNKTGTKPFFLWHLRFADVFEEKGGFDVVIANPPWVFTRVGEFEDDIKSYIYDKYLKNLKGSQQGRARQSGKINLYAIFVLQSLNLLKEHGLLTYILPNTILRATVYDVIRKSILDNSKILKIADLSAGVFENVTASTILLFLENSSNQLSDNKLSVIDNLVEREGGYQKEIPQNKFLNNISYAFNIYSNEIVDSLTEKIKANSNRLDVNFDVFAGGIATGPGKSNYISDKPLNSTYKPLVEGKDVKMYKLTFNRKYILYDRKKLYRAREESIFLSPEKLITQRIGGGVYPLIVAYDNKQYYTFNSTNSILPNENSPLKLKYLLALLNSTLMNWYYTVQYTNKSTLTVNISKTFLEQLPIKSPNDNEQEEVIKMVEKILEITDRSDYNNDNKQLLEEAMSYRNKIDQFVYKLYGLTEDEKRIVEGNDI